MVHSQQQQQQQQQQQHCHYKTNKQQSKANKPKSNLGSCPKVLLISV
jgi:hypothetical protein